MRVAIVDAYSTGCLLARELSARGVELVHVPSAEEAPPFYASSYDAGLFGVELGYHPDVRVVAGRLAQLGVTTVVPGTETGVPLADDLARRLGLRHNDPRTAEARWDKDAAARSLVAAGLDAPRGTRVTRARDAVAWWRAAGGGPVVVKPVASAGTDGVRFCVDPPGIEDAVRAILGAERNLLGRPNAAAVIQEHLSGPEFYVNTVSHDGAHRVVEMWRYHKRQHGGAPIYDYDVPVGPEASVVGVLRGYVRQVLTALGITDGPAHVEVMLTPRGPVLVDAAARLGGCADLPDVLARRHVSQVRATADWVVEPGSVLRIDEDAAPWSGISVRRVALVSDVSGPVQTMAWMDRLAAVDTVHMVVPRVGIGETVSRTVDLATSPGFVYLVGAEPDVARDYDRIRALERAGLYSTSVASRCSHEPVQAMPVHS